MDACSGKGQDLFRYAKYGTKNLLMTEIDKTAILEMISRKHEFAKSNTLPGKMNIMTQNIDYTAEYKTIVDQIRESRLPVHENLFEVIICNFAIHYFLSEPKYIENFARVISHYLKTGGKFLFSCFNGKKIIDLLKDKNYESKQKGKYSIRKEYAGNIISNTGQKIEVLLPFSLDQHYSEYVVNVEYLSKVFSKVGMSLEKEESFEEFISAYPKNTELDEDDKLYVGLYSYYTFGKARHVGSARRRR